MPVNVQDESVAVLLENQIAVGASGAWATKLRYFTFFIHAASVTSGAVIAIEALSPAGDWAAVDQRTISENGETVVRIEGPFNSLRARVVSRTDGTYTVSAIARNYA